MTDKKFGCPVCGFTSDDEKDVQDHMVEMADDPKHQEYEMKRDEEEQEKASEQE